MFAIAPPDTSRPAAPSPRPNWVANQRTMWCSISLAEGDSCHPPTFMLTAAASISATAPGTVPLPVTYARNRGWPHWTPHSIRTLRRCAISSASPSPCSGTGSSTASRTSPAGACREMGKPSSPSRYSAYNSTARSASDRIRAESQSNSDTGAGRSVWSVPVVDMRGSIAQ